ncbi:MAG: alpha/beta hydrolase [Brumimicrobium sp.]|nr:alpha/beta hydrolase [Brumimicrobium sp.]
MKTTIITTLAFLTTFTFSKAQNSQRYTDDIFTDIEVTTDVQYGHNLKYNDEPQDLLMDIYQPKDDTETARPVIILVHGGSFVGGSKDGGDVKPLAEAFAKKGYVTASIEYRLGIKDKYTKPTKTEMSSAVMRGTQDAKAAVRFFRKSFVEQGNPYGIDTANIFMGGSSAGGFISLHLAYLDKDSEIPDYMDLNSASLQGGLEGNSGNPGYSSKVKAIINISGAIGDVTWMENNTTPVLSFHGDQDKTVPFGTGNISILIFKIMKIDGSATIHQKADELGIANTFVPEYGAGHVPHSKFPEYMDTTINDMTIFLANILSEGQEDVSVQSVRDTTQPSYHTSVNNEIYKREEQ